MENLSSLLDLLLHFDQHLQNLAAGYRYTAYFLLFGIVFAETGFVLTPFLPGDSLLFAAGALAATGVCEIRWLIPILLAAAIAGDTVNYWAGAAVGQRVFSRETRFLNRQHLERTRIFYERYGERAVIIGRFLPVIRTFVPFVAGVAGMKYGQFLVANAGGAILWVGLCTGAGYFWGNLPFVKQNFGLVIAGIIVISLLPALLSWVGSRGSSKGPDTDPAPL
jgi:membrane-associated protein